MQDATNSSNDHRVQSRPVSSWPTFGLEASRRQQVADDFTPALMGVSAALGVLALLWVLLASGVAGVEIFEGRKLERFAFSTVATSIGGVSAAFFCGGWVHGTLRLRRHALGRFDELAGRIK